MMVARLSMRLSKVVWHEGMHLAPQHFQLQSRYFEDTVHFVTSSLWNFSYGLTACVMDHDALLGGAASVLDARGIFPDGLVFNMPGSDPAPAPRDINSVFSPTAEAHVLCLAVPSVSYNGERSIAVNGDRPEARFSSVPRTVFDENAGSDEQVVQVGRKNFRLLLDSECGPELSALPLARIRRDGSGRFVYDPDYIPPCLDLSASAALMRDLNRLVEMLDEKSAAIRESAPRARGVPAVDARELTAFWFLHTIHSSLPVLRNLLLAKRGHPEELYTEVAKLAGGLCSFSLESRPRDLPRYDHDDLTGTIAALLRHIEKHLNLMLPANCVSIPLERTADYLYRGAIEDTRHLDASRWILSIQSKAGEADVITKSPRLVKVCSHRFIGELVRRAVPGLALTHLPAPPPAVPARPEAQYFGITKAGPCWEHIIETRQVGVYVPGELPDAALELLIVLDT
jgi:type VI secretion system protein ImpJ